MYICVFAAYACVVRGVRVEVSVRVWVCGCYWKGTRVETSEREPSLIRFLAKAVLDENTATIRRSSSVQIRNHAVEDIKVCVTG